MIYFVRILAGMVFYHTCLLCKQHHLYISFLGWQYEVNDTTSMPTMEHCQCWHQLSWTLPSEEGQELLQSDMAYQNFILNTSGGYWKPHPKPLNRMFLNGEHPNFHSNICLGQTHCHFNLTGTYHIVEDTGNWNLRGHTVNLLYLTGLCGGTRIAVDLLIYEAVWPGEQVHFRSGRGGGHCKLELT